ncbi:hypothetical protein LTR94_024189 [Friedmanniomyces endolithicus]|nr:hypothetical protein LTR94_024189 [Friedmanniomyces endolithicus]
MRNNVWQHSAGGAPPAVQRSVSVSVVRACKVEGQVGDAVRIRIFNVGDVPCSNVSLATVINGRTVRDTAASLAPAPSPPASAPGRNPGVSVQTPTLPSTALRNLQAVGGWTRDYPISTGPTGNIRGLPTAAAPTTVRVSLYHDSGDGPPIPLDSLSETLAPTRSAKP